MLKFIEDKECSLKGMTLMISGISVGNVPVLTCDEIISHNGFKRIAYFQTSHLEPSIGYLPANI